MTRWIADDEPLVDTDVVLWYVFGIHHITRVEDWPMMPADTISFWLKPFGFFDQNPSMDAPGTSKAGGHSHPDHTRHDHEFPPRQAERRPCRTSRFSPTSSTVRSARRHPVTYSTSSTRRPARSTRPRPTRAADVDAACQAAAAAFENYRWTTPGERQRYLLKLADVIEEDAEELARIECENTGKPFALTMSEEIPPMVDQIRFFAGAAGCWRASRAAST